MDLKIWDAEAWLAAIVEDAEDAIVSKDLNGVIMSWNRGARRMFGYTAEEVIGQHISLLIPTDRLKEEEEILRQIRSGVRIEPFETVRRRKDGSQLHVSLSISPIRDRDGAVIGASKLARDISEQKLLQEKQALLLQEMNHRVKNLFTLASTVVALSAPHARTPQELSSALQQRLASLAAAHQLTLSGQEATPTSPNGITTLRALIRAIVAPYQGSDEDRIHVSGSEMEIGRHVFTSLALLLHEFASNSAKYGALSMLNGSIDICLGEEGDFLKMDWKEKGGPVIVQEPVTKGFGSRLEYLVAKSFDAKISRQWHAEGLRLEFIAPIERIAPDNGN